MNYQDYIYLIFGFLGLPALFSLYLTERVKGDVRNTFDKKLEEIKKNNAKEIEELKKEHLKELSQFHAELNNLKSKENFKFTKLHEKRFEVMAETYKCLTETLFKLRIYVAPLKAPHPEKTIEESSHMHFMDYIDAEKKLYEYYNFNKIYFNDEIEELLEKYINSSKDIFNQYAKNEFVNQTSFLFNAEVYRSSANAYNKIPELIEPIQLEIKNKVRELLGE
ncbi:hypothetical protein [Flavobacterium anhuiense]|uniref:hypothetical protein n=1 Tax=Flavobacterium anhuiense TaxID=459526 RepID=UPI000E6D1279|nr:hypothetical protein [Flavobacterium anhuiense]